MNLLQKSAEILVESGDAEYVKGQPKDIIEFNYTIGKPTPFSDTLEGRRQRDAIKNYLRSTVELRTLWQRSLLPFSFMYDDCYEWDNLRIKWCVEQLIEAEKDE